ncbi:MAG TPA: cytochrome P450 [Herpetosiphonaceae bacterium]
MTQQIMQPIIQPNLASPQFKANPFPFFARLRAEAPVYRAQLSRRESVWLVARYDDVLAVLKDERFGKDRFKAMTQEQQAKMPWMPGMIKPLTQNMLDLDAPDHTRLRGLVHKAFTPRLIEQLRGRVHTLCDELLDAVLRRGHMDLVRDYALPLPVTIIAEMLGIPPKDRTKFTRWSNSIVSVGSSSEVLRALPSIWLFMRYLRKRFEERRAAPQDDLITALVQAEEAGDRLSEDELLAMVLLLLIAGHETTVNLIANGTLALLEHREQMERLRGEPELIKPAIEELLRYTSPVYTSTERFAREDLTLCGVMIRRGEQVLAVIASANRDEQHFERPDALDLARDPNRHLSFGQGIHYCLGAPLARLESQIAVDMLLRRMPDLRLATAPDALRWRRGLVLRGLHALPVAF